MPVVSILVILVVVGIVLWLVNTYIPMSEPIKKLLNVVAVVCVIIWLLKVFNLLHFLNSVKV